jgi:hypothetical protein
VSCSKSPFHPGNAGLISLGALLLAPPTYAQPRHQQDGKPLRIVIETIDHSKQRYPTVGDWRFEKDGTLRVTVSKMSRRDVEVGIAVHELVEAVLCAHAGITQDMVDRFDLGYEAKRRPGDNSEPGDSKSAPYHKQHLFAERVERMVIHELGADWLRYAREIEDK